jgi:hypothetical protein
MTRIRGQHTIIRRPYPPFQITLSTLGVAETFDDRPNARAGPRLHIAAGLEILGSGKNLLALHQGSLRHVDVNAA